MWRPENWKNPYSYKFRIKGRVITNNQSQAIWLEQTYEAGADDMLQAVFETLIKLGYERVVEDCEIFMGIPDEDEFIPPPYDYY